MKSWSRRNCFAGESLEDYLGSEEEAAAEKAFPSGADNA